MVYLPESVSMEEVMIIAELCYTWLKKRHNPYKDYDDKRSIHTSLGTLFRNCKNAATRKLNQTKHDL